MKNLKLMEHTSAFKVDDTHTLIKFSAWDNDMRVVLKDSKATFKIRNSIGFVKSVEATPVDTYTVAIDSKLLTDLTPDTYFAELWLDNEGHTSIYPDSGTVKFVINSNVLDITGEVITSISVTDFDRKIAGYKKDLQSEFEQYVKSLDTIKGDPGRDGQNGRDGRDGQDGQNGQDGKSAYVHIAYSRNANELTAEPKKDSKFVGICINNSKDPVTDRDKFDWLQIGATDYQVQQALQQIAWSTGWLSDGFDFGVDVTKFKYQILTINGAKTLQLLLNFRCPIDLLKQQNNKIADLPRDVNVDGYQYLHYHTPYGKGSLRVSDNAIITDSFDGVENGVSDVFVTGTLFLQ